MQTAHNNFRRAKFGMIRSYLKCFSEGFSWAQVDFDGCSSIKTCYFSNCASKSNTLSTWNKAS